MDSKYQLSRRAVLTILIGGAGGAALIGGTTGIIPLSAEPAAGSAAAAHASIFDAPSARAFAPAATS